MNTLCIRPTRYEYAMYTHNSLMNTSMLRTKLPEKVDISAYASVLVKSSRCDRAISKTFKVHLIFVFIYVLLMPRPHLHVKLSRKSHTRTWSGATSWQLRGICGNRGVYVLLRGASVLKGCHNHHVTATFML